MKPWGPGLLRVFNHSFNFSACDWSVRIFYFSWFSLGRLYLSKNCVNFFQVVPVESVVTSLFSFLILLFEALSLFS